MKSEPPQTPLPEALRCPITGAPLEWDASGLWINVVGHPLRYPVQGGIPVLVEPAAQRPDSSGVAPPTR